jgi:hypothetical protein
MRRTIGISLALVLLSAPAVAEGIDVKKPFLCAVTETVECGHDGNCIRGGAEDIDFPAFIEVELAKKQMRERDGERMTQIRSQDRVDGHLMLQGIQGDRAWSMNVVEGTGKMATTAASRDVGFMVFGVCTEL